MIMKSCILALDVGTSAVKASLVSEKLKIIGEISCGYPTYTPRMRQVEQNPQDWWYAACRASRELMECLGGYSVEAVAVSGHMLGLLSVDKRGEPLTASMIHADTRSETEADYIAHAFGKDYMYDLTGNVLSPAATLCKALWLKENMGDIYKKSARFLQCKDYLNFRMTGNLNSTDYSDASHGMLIDIRKKRYLSDVFADIGLNSELFPELHASTDIIGRLTQNAAVELGLVSGIPVVAGGRRWCLLQCGCGHWDSRRCVLLLGNYRMDRLQYG